MEGPRFGYTLEHERKAGGSTDVCAGRVDERVERAGAGRGRRADAARVGRGAGLPARARAAARAAAGGRGAGAGRGAAGGRAGGAFAARLGARALRLPPGAAGARRARARRPLIVKAARHRLLVAPATFYSFVPRPPPRSHFSASLIFILVGFRFSRRSSARKPGGRDRSEPSDPARAGRPTARRSGSSSSVRNETENVIVTKRMRRVIAFTSEV